MHSEGKTKSRVMIVAEHVEFKPIKQPAPEAAEETAEEAAVAKEAAAMVFEEEDQSPQAGALRRCRRDHSPTAQTSGLRCSNRRILCCG